MIILKQSKYFVKALVNGEYPKSKLSGVFFPSTSDFHHLEKASETKNCFITWKEPTLTKTHAVSYQQFIDQNHDFQFTFFDDNTMAAWMRSHCRDLELYKIFINSKFSASRVDIFRLAILAEYGGVYTSINRVFIHPITATIGTIDKFVISFERFKYLRDTASAAIPQEFREFSVVQHSIAAPSGHPLLMTAIEEIKRSAHLYMGIKFPSVKEAIWRFTGSLMLTRSVDLYLNSEGSQNVKFLGFEFNDSIQIPRGSEFRYAASPSYLGAKNQIILERFT